MRARSGFPGCGMRLRVDFAARLRRRSAGPGARNRCGNCAAKTHSFVYAETDTPTPISRWSRSTILRRPPTAGPLHGTAEAHRAPSAPLADLPSATAARPARARLSLLDRGRALRPRIPRAPRRAAEAGRLAAVLHPGVAHPCAPARHDTPALGAVPRRGAGCVSRSAEGQLRDPRQDPPRGDRCERRGRDHDAPARYDAAATRRSRRPNPGSPNRRRGPSRSSLARRSTTPCSRSRSPRHSRGCSAG